MASENEPIIVLDDVGVRFLSGPTARSLADLWNSMFERNKNKKKHFWALRHVSFTINRGDLVSVIGKNGAGKSTLLRVVAKILDINEGILQVNTKCNLLSSGVGQKPLLSGRDNIYLGCLLLGHTMEEIRKNFDSMVKFAELEDHIDRPIRYYSSGMLSRLLFTIATTIKPNFLLLDELLSAGDIGFVDKANKRMQEIIKKAEGGLIATHDMNFARNFSTKSLYLKDGNVKFFGNPDEAVDMYEKDLGLK
jgi:ABC-type polysaccharide/polyol phosphate transport system ATPase subunit